ncbi:MAG: hypothetical protein OXQ30_00560 [Boseongicola sp.]|nr:hypothetical protein [Boseongicola sp.]
MIAFEIRRRTCPTYRTKPGSGRIDEVYVCSDCRERTAVTALRASPQYTAACRDVQRAVDGASSVG